MKTYLIHIRLPDGSSLHLRGHYSDGFDAILQTLTAYPEAKSISALRDFAP